MESIAREIWVQALAHGLLHQQREDIVLDIVKKLASFVAVAFCLEVVRFYLGCIPPGSLSMADGAVFGMLITIIGRALQSLRFLRGRVKLLGAAAGHIRVKNSDLPSIRLDSGDASLFGTILCDIVIALYGGTAQTISQRGDAVVADTAKPFCAADYRNLLCVARPDSIDESFLEENSHA